VKTWEPILRICTAENLLSNSYPFASCMYRAKCNSCKKNYAIYNHNRYFDWRGTSFFFTWPNSPPSGPRPPHCRGFMITDTPHSIGLLWSSDQSDVETFTWQHTTLTADMPPAGFEFTIPASEQPQTHALNRAASGIGSIFFSSLKLMVITESTCLTDIKVWSILYSQRVQKWRIACGRTYAFE
jgi:hypothetical protein